MTRVIIFGALSHEHLCYNKKHNLGNFLPNWASRYTLSKYTNCQKSFYLVSQKAAYKTLVISTPEKITSSPSTCLMTTLERDQTFFTFLTIRGLKNNEGKLPFLAIFRPKIPDLVFSDLYL